MLVTLLAACAPEVPTPAPEAIGEGLFLGGCPVEGQATARTLTTIDEAPWGPDALAAPGDVLLVNERSAWVIQGPDDPRTYYHYGGMPIDAVAVDGCEQAGPEILGELGFIVGQLELADFAASSLHMIRGDSVEIVSDGRDGGPAIVDVHGTDDRFWLVELTLMREVFESGGRKPLGDLYGLDVTLRYTLEPGSTALQVEVLIGGEPITDEFLVGAVLFPSDHTTERGYAHGRLSVGGFGMDVGVPWIGDTSPTGATALAMPGATLAKTTISGVTAIIDVNQVGTPLEVGDSARFALAVSATDDGAAAAALEPLLDDPVPGSATEWGTLDGTVRDPSGAPVSGAVVEVRSPDEDGVYHSVTTFTTDAEGRFSGRTLSIGEWQVQATGAGRDDGAPLTASPGDTLDLDIGAWGAVEIVATDGASPLPVRVELERDDGATTFGYATPQDPTIAVPPGTWTAWVTRGYEHAPVETTIVVPEDGTAVLTAELPLVVDTTGWISLDSHVHAGPSADADTLPVDRMRTVAASGLDLVVSTDHEAIIDLSPAITEAGVDVTYALGSEVTASLPEHTNAWPFPTTDDVRGDPVRWYGFGFPGIYAAERDRGAQVIQLNHARVNGECGILCILDWDRLSEPATDDPLALGFSEAVWSWDFDSFELLNGLRSPYWTEDPRTSGALYDWLAFHNLGHPVTAMGVTDVHGLGTPGTPRTFVAVDDDTFGAFDATDAADAVLAGAAQVSAGAFARVDIDGAGPGDTVHLDADGTLTIHIEALPAIDVTDVDVLVDCDAWAHLDATDPGGVVKLDTTLPFPAGQDAYVVVIARGTAAMPRGLEGYDAAVVPRVVVNPIFVDGDGDGVWTAPGPKVCDWVP